MEIGERIRAAREGKGWSQTDLANNAKPFAPPGVKVNQQDVERIENGGVKKSSKIPPIEAALGLASSVVASDPRSSSPPEPSVRLPDVQPEFPWRDNMPKDVEVLGTTQGGDEGAMSFNGDVVEYVRRPPGLSGARDIYALYVVNDSMARKYEPGDLIYVSKSRPPRAGDYVVIEMHSEVEGDPGNGFIKLLKALTPTKIMVEQFNPPTIVEFDKREVKTMHRVFTTNELLGM